jgi:hypothetical protein
LGLCFPGRRLRDSENENTTSSGPFAPEELEGYSEIAIPKPPISIINPSALLLKTGEDVEESNGEAEALEQPQPSLDVQGAVIPERGIP